MSGKDNCVCNFGDSANHPGYGDGKTWCWANLQPKEDGSGYKMCEEIKDNDTCNNSVGPDGYTCEFDDKKKVCGVVGVNTHDPGSVQRAKPGLQGIKCADCGEGCDAQKISWNDPKCKAVGYTGKDCRGCKGDGTMNKDYTIPMPITMPSSASCPSGGGGGGGGGGSTAAEAAAAIARAKRGLLPFEMVAATAGIELIAPLVCGPLQSATAAGDGAGNPVVQAMSNLLQCDKRSAAAAASPTPAAS